MIKISVIISAHDRRTYVKSAIESVLAQSFDRESYEIILVKNFVDRDIDIFCSKRNIKNILYNGKTLGQKMARGIDEANGEIISFLDDDDLFESNKLQTIYSRLSNGIELYHNDINFIKENGSRLRGDSTSHYSYIIYMSNFKNMIRKIREARAEWYMSCFSMSRKLALELKPLYETMHASFDKITFYYALAKGYRILCDSDKLTLYRLHPSLTTIKDDMPAYFNTKARFFRSSSDSLKSLLYYCKDSDIKDLIYYIFLHEYIIFLFMTKERNFPVRIIFAFLRLWVRYGILSDTIWLIFLIFKFFMPSTAHYIHYNRMLGYYETGQIM
ncbi:hypothetical protein DMB44_03630 [Thermoplasma sp. Kam2015]|uniref:glycosyltransferase family 2 protein n=1 Tax=Thermoplasma sp. Kam2015 TaxID=2094122 RepID=UPI000D80CCDF|nr:glycosyltransferase family 2 protein [Thermoplasma sp. Kam2015]PYB68574.1 hypothetical protein DMB44_03630 [Thermoplasma sp. Kam2015]